MGGQVSFQQAGDWTRELSFQLHKQIKHLEAALTGPPREAGSIPMQEGTVSPRTPNTFTLFSLKIGCVVPKVSSIVRVPHQGLVRKFSSKRDTQLRVESSDQL